MTLKRLFTAVVLFVFSFVLVYFAICIVGGAVSGGMAGAQTHNAQDGYAAGQQAGASFVKDNMQMILFSSFAISFVSLCGLSFLGVLPWCRDTREPAEPLQF